MRMLDISLPVYKARGRERYIFSSGSDWMIGPGLVSPTGFHFSAGESPLSTRAVKSMSRNCWRQQSYVIENQLGHPKHQAKH